MIERQKIIEAAKKRGLTRSGYNFIDYQHGLLINSAYLISKVRRLSVAMPLEDAIEKILDDEALRLPAKK